MCSFFHPLLFIWICHCYWKSSISLRGNFQNAEHDKQATTRQKNQFFSPLLCSSLSLCTFFCTSMYSVCLWPKYVVYLVLALQHQWKANRWYVYNLITPLLPRNDWIIFYPLEATTLSEALKNKINNCRRSMSKALMKGPNTTCNLSWR